MPGVHAAPLDVGRNPDPLVLRLRSHTCRHWRCLRVRRVQNPVYRRLCGAILPIDEGAVLGRS